MCGQMQGVFCHVFSATLLCAYLRDGKRKGTRDTFIWRLFRSLRQPQRATLRDSHQGNQFTIHQSWPSYWYANVRVAPVSESRELRRPAWAAAVAESCVVSGGGMFPDEWLGEAVRGGRQPWFMAESEAGPSVQLCDHYKCLPVSYLHSGRLSCAFSLCGHASVCLLVYTCVLTHWRLSGYLTQMLDLDRCSLGPCYESCFTIQRVFHYLYLWCLFCATQSIAKGAPNSYRKHCHWSVAMVRRGLSSRVSDWGCPTVAQIVKFTKANWFVLLASIKKNWLELQNL